MAALEVAMKKHHISLDSSLESTSHGHGICASSYSYTTSSSSTSIEWLIDSGTQGTPKRYLIPCSGTQGTPKRLNT